jgi:hypothetical protein
MTDDLPISASVERVAGELEAKASRIRAKAQAAERMAGELEPYGRAFRDARRRLEVLEHVAAGAELIAEARAELELAEDEQRAAIARFDDAAGRLERELGALDGSSLEEIAQNLERLGR